MNILLLIDVLLPKYSGMTLRVINVFREISKKNDVHFVYIGNEKIQREHQEILQDFCITINHISLKKKEFFLGKVFNVLQLKPGFCAKYKFKEDYDNVKKRLKEFIRKNKIEVIHVFGCFTSQYVKDFENIIKIWDVADSYSLDVKRKIKNAPNLSKIGLFIYMLRLFNYEKEIIKKFFTTIFVSSIDANVYNKLNLRDKIYVIPNGVDLDYFKPQSDSIEESATLIFTGKMNFAPNIEAVKYFINRIYRLIKKEIPQVKFYIVGTDETEEIRKFNNKNGIIVTGRVDDIRPFLTRATVFINPMISGCGIKNKVLQAMAMNKAIVSSSLGVESISVVNNTNIFLADDPSRFANKVIALIRNRKLRMSLGKEARKTVEKEYSWDKALLIYEQIYESFNKKL